MAYTIPGIKPDFTKEIFTVLVSICNKMWRHLSFKFLVMLKTLLSMIKPTFWHAFQILYIYD